MCGFGIPKYISGRPTTRFICSILFLVPFLVRLVWVLEVHGILVASSTPPSISTTILSGIITRATDGSWGCRTGGGLQTPGTDNPLDRNRSEFMDDSESSSHPPRDPLPIQPVDVWIHASSISSLCGGIHCHYSRQDVPVERK